jgi:hypothetical protein
MIATVGGALKCIVEACVRVLDLWNPTCKHNPTSDHNEHEREHLDETNDIHAADSPFGEKGVQSRDEGDDSNGDPSFLPLGGSPASYDKGVLCKDYASVSWIEVSVWIESTSELLACDLPEKPSKMAWKANTVVAKSLGR